MRLNYSHLNAKVTDQHKAQNGLDNSKDSGRNRSFLRPGIFPLSLPSALPSWQITNPHPQGFEAIKQLLTQPQQPYRFVLGARDVPRTQAAYDAVKYDSSKHDLTVLPLELSDLKSTKSFAQQALSALDSTKVDYLFLNAGITNGAEQPTGKSKYCEAYVVNHLSQHYLIHLLREKLVADKARIVVVSSGAVRSVKDVSRLDADLKDGSGVGGQAIYSKTKFVQLLGAHWWRRQLKGTGCEVVAVSPGLIPNTGIGRGSGMKLSMDMPDAKTVDEGERQLFNPFFSCAQFGGAHKHHLYPQVPRASSALLHGTIFPRIQSRYS